MDDFAQLAAAVTDFAGGNDLTIVPAVPKHEYGPEVCLGPDALELPGFLALASKLAGGVLYLRAVPFDPASGNDQPEDPPAHLLRHKGRIGQVSVAFAANGLVHFWEHQTHGHRSSPRRPRPRRGIVLTPGTCLECGAPLTIPPTGRRPVYCGKRCRQAAHRARQAAAAAKHIQRLSRQELAAAGGELHGR